jgi:hypothetical protein
MIINRVFKFTGIKNEIDDIGFIDDVPFYRSEYEYLLELDEIKYEEIKQWVDSRLMPYMTRESINEAHSSYRLKHIAENELNFYVSNGDIKYALLENSVPFKSYDRSPNTTYPLSQNFYKTVRR